MRFIFGLILIGVAVAAMIFLIQDPAENETLNSALAQIVCQPGENISQWMGASQRNSSGTWASPVAYACVRGDAERDVTGQVIGIIVAGFAVPFILGLMLMMSPAFGGGRRRRHMQHTLVTNIMSAYQNAPGTTSEIVVNGKRIQFTSSAHGMNITVNGQPVMTTDTPSNTPSSNYAFDFESTDAPAAPPPEPTHIMVNGVRTAIADLPYEEQQKIRTAFKQLNG